MSEDAAYPKGLDGRPVSLEARDRSDDGRMYSPSVARNKEVLRDAFWELLPDARRVLEIASGSGEHAVCIAGARPGVEWTTSDPDPDSRRSIAGWIASDGGGQVRGPLDIDASRADWGVSGVYDVVLAINMIHIAPIDACVGVFSGSAKYVGATGAVFFYGPFSRNGVHTAASNADFDVSLKRRDPRWGVRDLERDVAPLAEAAGFRLARAKSMPANNLSVVFERR